MSKENQLLKDSEVKPTEEMIASGLGLANDVYIKFIDRLRHNNITLMEWRYYNDGKAWLSKGEYNYLTARGTSKVKPIFWLSIWDGFFKVSFNFSKKTKDKLISLPISQKTKELIKNTKPNGNTMKFLSVIFDVKDEEQLEDIYILSEFRKENI